MEDHHHQPIRSCSRGDDHEIVLDLPPGFRFHPSDEEIITHYLTEKVKDPNFTAIAVGEADLNKSEPWDLPGKAKMGEKEWYFFCQRDKKYPTGMRTNRATQAGYWKATGKDKEIFRGRGCLVGMKKTLVFYRGRAPKGHKTNWVMHEFRLEGNFSYYSFPKSSKDEWVVCRVFHKSPAAAASSAGGVVMKRGSSPIEHLMRLNSFDHDHFFINSSSLSLPPLMDLPYADHLLNDYAARPSSSSSQPNSTYTTFPNAASSSHLYTFPNPAAAAGGGGFDNSGGQYYGDCCKLEQQQQQQSMVSLSQDTGLSTDNMSAAPEISSRNIGGGGVKVLLDGLEDPSTTSAGGSTTGMVELDSFWDNY